MSRTRTATTLVTTAVAALALLTAAGSAAARPVPDEHARASYEIGLFGDMPYGDTGRAQFPALLADMNTHDLAFSLFDGDMKNGSEPCYASYDGSAQAAGKPDVYTAERDLLNTLKAPVIVTPGDNEWTDCDRPATKGPTFDAVDRLAYERQVFFASPQTQGAHPTTVTRQSAAYPENAVKTAGGVTYATVNIPGSDNDFAVTPADGNVAEAQAEYTARNAANLSWIRATFDAATAQHSKAVMIVIQADMFPQTNSGSPSTHFADTKALLARESAAFAGQVVLVNGDSHYFLEDKPLTDDAGNTIENVTRVMTFGSGQSHWVSATVDPRTPEVFTFHQHVVAANVPAYSFSG